MDEELAAVVGLRIRRLRQREGLSLRRQAARVGVSPSALSALENGRGGMSLSALQRVGGHFGLSITELLALPPESSSTPEHETPSVEVFERSASSPSAVKRGAGTLYHLLGSGSGHLLQPYVISFAPGGGYASDAISHPGEEFAYVVVGEVNIVIEGEAIRLRQGDAIRFRTEARHSFTNVSESSVALVIGAATPPW